MLSPLAPYRQIGILGSHIPIGMSDRPKLLILTDSRWPPEWHNNRYTWDNKSHKNKFRICQPASTPYSISWLMGYWLTGKFWIFSCDKCVLVLCASRLPTSYCQKEISMANFSHTTSTWLLVVGTAIFPESPEVVIHIYCYIFVPFLIVLYYYFAFTHCTYCPRSFSHNWDISPIIATSISTLYRFAAYLRRLSHQVQLWGMLTIFYYSLYLLSHSCRLFIYSYLHHLIPSHFYQVVLWDAGHQRLCISHTTTAQNTPNVYTLTLLSTHLPPIKKMNTPRRLCGLSIKRSPGIMQSTSNGS